VSQHARNAVGCRGDETFEGFGGFSNNPRARRARKTKNATGHLGLFSTAVGRDTVTDPGWFSDEDLVEIWSRRGTHRGYRTRSSRRPCTSVPVRSCRSRTASCGSRGGEERASARRHWETRAWRFRIWDARGDVCRAIDATRGPRVGPVGAAGHTRQRVGSRRWDRTRRRGGNRIREGGALTACA